MACLTDKDRSFLQEMTRHILCRDSVLMYLTNKDIVVFIKEDISAHDAGPFDVSVKIFLGGLRFLSTLYFPW